MSMHVPSYHIRAILGIGNHMKLGLYRTDACRMAHFHMGRPIYLKAIGLEHGNYQINHKKSNWA